MGNWTEFEDTIIKEYYAVASIKEMQELLPERTKNAIKKRASILNCTGTMERARELARQALFIKSDITGNRYGKLTVLERVPEVTKAGNTKWLCLCDCGNTKVIAKGNLLAGGTTSCGCYQLERNRERNKKAPNVALTNYLYKRYIQGANKRNLAFALTLEQFITIISLPCEYCGQYSKMDTQHRKNNDREFSGVDRKDNSKGYTLENSVSCCGECNFRKNKSSEDEFRAWVKRAYEHMFC